MAKVANRANRKSIVKDLTKVLLKIRKKASPEDFAVIENAMHLAAKELQVTIPKESYELPTEDTQAPEEQPETEG